MSLAEVQQRERQARWETRARLRAGVYADSDQTHVLTFRQRDCVVQYIGVVRCLPSLPACVAACVASRARAGPATARAVCPRCLACSNLPAPSHSSCAALPCDSCPRCN
jgi:hypothetical protein